MPDINLKAKLQERLAKATAQSFHPLSKKPLEACKSFNQIGLRGLVDLQTEDQTYGRGYIVDGEIFPSITTVVGIHNEKHISEWKARVGEEEAKRVSEKATIKGNAVHEICEYYLKNELDNEKFQGYIPEGKEAFWPIKDILDKNVNNILAQEVTLFSKKYRIAGRVDLIAEYNNILSIIDFKTSSKMKLPSWIESYFMQETAYALMLYEMTGIRINQLVTIMTVEDDFPQVFIEKPENHFKNLVKTRNQFYHKYGV